MSHCPIALCREDKNGSYLRDNATGQCDLSFVKLATGERERVEIEEKGIKVAVRSLITLHGPGEGGRKGRARDKKGRSTKLKMYT